MFKIAVIIAAIMLLANQVGQVILWSKSGNYNVASMLIPTLMLLLFDVIIGLALINGVE